MRVEDLHHKELLELDPEGGVIHFAGQRALLLDAVAMGLLRQYLVDNFGLTAARAVLTQFGFAHGWRMAAAMQKEFQWGNDEEWRRAGPHIYTLEGLFRIQPGSEDPLTKEGAKLLASYEAEQHLLHFMRNALMTFAVVMVLALGMTACGKRTPSEKASDAGKSAGQTARDAAKATGNAVGDAAKATGNVVGGAAKATGEYLSQSKDTAVKAAQETLNGVEKKWQDLLAKAAPTTDAAKDDLRKARDEMARTLADAKAKLIQAKDASAGAWHENVKPTLEAAVQKAQRLYHDAADRFGSK